MSKQINYYLEFEGFFAVGAKSARVGMFNSAGG